MKETKKKLAVANLVFLGTLMFAATVTVSTNQEVKAQTYTGDVCPLGPILTNFAVPNHGCSGSTIKKDVGYYCSTHNNVCCLYHVFQVYCAADSGYMYTEEDGPVAGETNAHCSGSTCYLNSPGGFA